jgi:hypothetical protein
MTAELFDKCQSEKQLCVQCCTDMLFKSEALYNTHTLSKTMCTAVTQLYNYRPHTHKHDFLNYYPVLKALKTPDIMYIETLLQVDIYADTEQSALWQRNASCSAVKYDCHANSGTFRFTVHLWAYGTQCQQAAASYADRKMSFIKRLALIA